MHNLNLATGCLPGHLQKLEKSGVTVNAMAPGLVPGSNLFSKMSMETQNMLKQRGGTDIEQGADTAVWLAADTEVGNLNGKFFEQRKEIACEYRNVEDEEKLLGICESMVR